MSGIGRPAGGPEGMEEEKTDDSIDRPEVASCNENTHFSWRESVNRWPWWGRYGIVLQMRIKEILMKKVLMATLAVLASLAAGAAHADRVYWSVGVNAPNVGTVITNAPRIYVPPPPVYIPPPQVVYQPPQVVYQPPQVVYQPYYPPAPPVVYRRVTPVYEQPEWRHHRHHHHRRDRWDDRWDDRDGYRY